MRKPNFISDMILEYRTRKNLTQRELAEIIDTTPMFMSLIELGKTKIPFEKLGKLIQVLEMPESEILDYYIQKHRDKIGTEIASGKETARAKKD